MIDRQTGHSVMVNNPSNGNQNGDMKNEDFDGFGPTEPPTTPPPASLRRMHRNERNYVRERMIRLEQEEKREEKERELDRVRSAVSKLSLHQDNITVILNERIVTIN